MIEIQNFESCQGVKIELPNANLLIIYAKKGYVMCGYLNLEKAESLGDAACLVSGVSSLDDVLEAKIQDLTSKARMLGIEKGMTGKKALEFLA